MVTLGPWPNEAQKAEELYGGAWSGPEGWARRRERDGCIVCSAGRPFGILGELASTWVTTDREVPVFGYTCVVSKVHVVEPFELPETESAGFWRDCMAVAKALNDLVRPVKMNYEVHGNTLPHLHMHLFPRQRGDAFVGRPLNLKEVHHRYSEAEVEALRAMVAELALGVTRHRGQER